MNLISSKSRQGGFSLVSLFVVLLALTSMFGCGRVVSSDPRCAKLCDREVDPKYDYCDAKSVTECSRQCDARIKDLPTVCQSCLIEGAYFNIPDRPSPQCTTADKGATYTCSVTNPTDHLC
jgi:hypothetical protein